MASDEVLLRELFVHETMPHVYALYVKDILAAPTMKEAAATVRKAVAVSTQTCKWFPRPSPSPWAFFLLPLTRTAARIAGTMGADGHNFQCKDALNKAIGGDFRSLVKDVCIQVIDNSLQAIVREFPRILILTRMWTMWSHTRVTGGEHWTSSVEGLALDAPLLLVERYTDGQVISLEKLVAKKEHFKWVVPLVPLAPANETMPKQ